MPSISDVWRGRCGACRLTEEVRSPLGSGKTSADRVRIRLFGELARFSGGRGDEFDWPLAEGLTVAGVLSEIGIPDKEVWMVALNGTRVGPDVKPNAGDEVMIFSPVGGG